MVRFRDVQTETLVAHTMVAEDRISPLTTDAYKYSMAQVGFPLRTESFYLSFRRPGWYLQPFNLEALVNALLPATATAEERTFLTSHGYSFTADMDRALPRNLVTIDAAPKGSWVGAGEPFVSVTGPSFLVSWLEAVCIWLQFPIQVATAARLDGRRRFVCTCDDEATIARATLAAIGLHDECEVIVDTPAFAVEVRSRARRLRSILSSKPATPNINRAFEVGMRGATCLEMHRLALLACKSEGLTMTSNLLLAKELDLIPVGTTGHEHQLRFGDDFSAFRAIRDGRSGAPSYLFDSFDTHALGIPAAIEVLREAPSTSASVRFDSGCAKEQIRAFLRAEVAPTFIFMDGMNPSRIAALESFTEHHGIPATRRQYGLGGYLVGGAVPGDLTRDRVSAVYKLSETGGTPVMKFSANGKQSLPGRLCILRRVSGSGPSSLVAQHGERIANYQPLAPAKSPPTHSQKLALSPETKSLVQQLTPTLTQQRKASA